MYRIGSKLWIPCRLLNVHSILYKINSGKMLSILLQICFFTCLGTYLKNPLNLQNGHFLVPTKKKQFFECMDKLEKIFGKIDHIKSMQLDAEFTALSLNDFPTIVDYITIFKELLTQLKGSG